MKHSTFDSFSNNTLFINGKVDLKKCPIELLLHTAVNRGERYVFLVDPKNYINIFSDINKNLEFVDFLPPKSSINQDSPIGFKSEIFECRNKVLSSASMGDYPFVLITTENAFVEKSFSPNKDQSFYISSDSNYEDLFNWLKISNYNFTDTVVAQGDCSIKGGIIDIFPYNKLYPVRISFLAEDIEVFCFEIESQISGEKVKLNRLSKMATESKLSLSESIPNDFKILELSISDTELIKKTPFSALSYNQFHKQEIDPNTEVKASKYLNSNAYQFKDLIIVPNWFLDKGQGLKEDNFQEVIDFNALTVGDLIVHKYHGLGVFKGVYDFGGEHHTDERLLLEYSDSGKIYVSVHNLGLLEYHGSNPEAKIELDSLSKKGLWNSKKKKAKKQVDEIIDDLLKSYATRTTVKKTPLELDLEIESHFLNSFPFEDTKDQASSWKEVSEDLVSNKPMDRLLCGDVGFGKTEIALRAAFRTAFSGKQVAVLAPTTILSSQHYHSFKNRLSPFSIEVGLLSGFKTKSDNNNTLRDLKNGGINVIIGTHSLLSEKVIFKNLGLLIIDEEHRFGVKQKEIILGLKNNIDVLSMSATPIPRTLHMSLSGIKSISTINTPPKARFPIKTQIQYYDIKQIKSIILFEISREGQVFFVHNSVKSLDAVVQSLKQHLPNLNIEQAHGQESKKLLEKTMNSFIGGNIDVLVCTSIIETGIDIPNVNTIIINRAQNFGLSQLYQIRGRVGRSDKQAYAYLLIPKGLQLSQNAYKRLKSIEKNTSLGSGYNISKNDMEIRGVGTIFGYKQSGGLSQIGYGLYSKMIREVLEDRKIVEKQFVIDPEDVSVKLYFDMAIPDEYIGSESIRLEFYRKFATCDKIENFSKIEYELNNRYGPLPNSTKNLINNYKTRIYCAILGIKKCIVEKGEIKFDFLQHGVASKIDTFIPEVIEVTKEQNTEPRFLPGDNNELKVNIKLNKSVDIYTFVELIMDKLTAIFLV